MARIINWWNCCLVAVFLTVGLDFTATSLLPSSKNTIILPIHTPSDPKLFYATFQCFGTKAQFIQCCIVDASKAFYKVCKSCPRGLAHCPCNRHRHSFDAIKVKNTENLGLDVPASETALAWYNKKHGTAYQLVKGLRFNFWRENQFHHRVHCNFVAELENPCSPGDASLKLFFAEYVRSSSITVVDCCILDTEENLEAILHIQMAVNDDRRFCQHGVLSVLSTWCPSSP